MATEKKTISQRNDLFSYYDRLQMLLIIKRRIPIEITGRIIECPPQIKSFNGTIKKKGFTLARRRMAIDAKKQSALTILKEKLPEWNTTTESPIANSIHSASYRKRNQRMTALKSMRSNLPGRLANSNRT